MRKFAITVNAGFGIGLLVLSIWYFVGILPKLQTLYTQFGAPEARTSTLVPFFMLVYGAVSLFASISLLKKKRFLQKLFLTLPFISFVLVGIVLVLFVYSVILPIYNLTTSI